MRLEAEKIHNVLVIGLSCIGDMVLATAALWNLRRFLPHARFTILASPQAMQVLEKDPLWDVVEEYKRKKGFWGRIDSVRMIRSIPHDLLIDLRSSAMPLVCGARYAPFWGLRELLLPKEMHEAERNIWCMQTLGVPVFSRQLRFFVPSEAREQVQHELMEKGAELPLVLLNPGSQNHEKNWPAEKFAALARKILGELNVMVGVTGYARYERKLAARICGEVHSERCLDFSGDFPIARLGALLERAMLFVTNDTGPLHVASAIGTPTVGLYRAKNLPRFGPWGTVHRSLVPAPPDDDYSMERIPVEEVWNACCEVLESIGSLSGILGFCFSGQEEEKVELENECDFQ